MSLLNVVRSAVKSADHVVKSLEPTVIFERMTGADGKGKRTYTEGPISLRVIVESKTRTIRSTGGELATISGTSVLFLDIDSLLLATKNQGVQEFDRITLSDGRTSPIMSRDGFVDAGTSVPVATEVFLA